jgi:tetratricopeptide (TPR) repeat protein
MAKHRKTDKPQPMKNVEETLTKTEQFLEENYKPLIYILGVIVVLVGLFWLARLYLNNRNNEAQSQMYQAQRYLEIDSLKLALNGDGNYLGFLDIAQQYKFTRAGNLALYSAGICYLHLGNFQEAIDYLNKYSKKDKVLGSIAIGAVGDAYVELGDIEKGISKYLEAAEYGDNAFNSPLYLMKAGELYETNGNYSEALKLYERIKEKYPESSEGTSIDRYIARAKFLNK